MGIFLRFVAKSSVCAAVVYATAEYGIWSDSQTTEAAFQRAKSSISSLEPYTPQQLKDMRSWLDRDWRLASVWNSGVTVVCRFLSAAPTCAACWSTSMLKKSYNQLMSSTKS